MASAFGHAVVAIAMGKSLPQKMNRWSVVFVGVVCTILPDIDVIAFKFGIPYGSFWGHRGFSHSLLFAAAWGLLCSLLFYRKNIALKSILLLWIYFFLCTASHALLDAMTNGGLGVAFFAPWDNARYFLPWRPIAVSPIGAARFFSPRGLEVLSSEALYVGLPSLVIWFFAFILRKRK